MKIYKTYKIRLYPNKNQEILINKTMGCSRFIYNQMLNERKKVYEKFKQNKKKLYSHKYKTEKQYKEEFKWLSEIDSIALQQSRVNLETAYINFFNSVSGKRKGKKINFPKFKSKKNNNQTYKTVFTNNNIKIGNKQNKIKLPKLNWIKFKDKRNINEKIKSITIRKTITEKYFACISVELEIFPKIHNPHINSKVIGLDMDMKNLFTSNEGKIANYPQFYRLYEKKLGKKQKGLSRKKLNSKRRLKQKLKVAKVYEKVTNSRKDFLQKLSTQIINKYDIIGVESLNMQAMSQCLKLGKSVHDNGWGMFINMLEYKALWKGKHLIFANKYYASTKMCNICGYKNTELTLADRKWSCPICHSKHDRDINAGKNLANYAKNTVGITEIQAHGEDVRPHINQIVENMRQTSVK